MAPQFFGLGLILAVFATQAFCFFEDFGFNSYDSDYSSYGNIEDQVMKSFNSMPKRMKENKEKMPMKYEHVSQRKGPGFQQYDMYRYREYDSTKPQAGKGYGGNKKTNNYYDNKDNYDTAYRQQAGNSAGKYPQGGAGAVHAGKGANNKHAGSVVQGQKPASGDGYRKNANAYPQGSDYRPSSDYKYEGPKKDGNKNGDNYYRASQTQYMKMSSRNYPLDGKPDDKAPKEKSEKHSPRGYGTDYKYSHGQKEQERYAHGSNKKDGDVKYTVYQPADYRVERKAPEYRPDHYEQNQNPGFRFGGNPRREVGYGAPKHYEYNYESPLRMRQDRYKEERTYGNGGKATAYDEDGGRSGHHYEHQQPKKAPEHKPAPPKKYPEPKKGYNPKEHKDGKGCPCK